MKAALFIDDDEIFNHIHEALAHKAALATHIYVVNSAVKGLVLLHELSRKTELPMPDVIFLDLMMPVMDGFGFLNEFEKLNDDIKRNIKIVILTSSLNADDRFRSFKHRHVVEFISKPLSFVNINNLKAKLESV
jgi:CheY-like chemotaxis protein